MVITELAVLKWLHILVMVYWLGGEWGVFNTSTHVINRELSMEERRRHMQTAYHIDILARIGIITLLPLGLHMGTFWGVQPYDGWYLVAMWVFVAGWLALCISAYIHRETDLGIRLTIYDEKVRYVIIPTAASQLTGFHRGLWPLQCRPWSVLVLNKDVPLLRCTHDWAQVTICDARVDRYVPNPCRGGECGCRDQVGKKLGLRQATGLFLLGAHCNRWLFRRDKNDLEQLGWWAHTDFSPSPAQ